MSASLVGSEMCIRDRRAPMPRFGARKSVFDRVSVCVCARGCARVSMRARARARARVRACPCVRAFA
eukprot:8859625-Alexandrium_andersonii.AAC.1